MKLLALAKISTIKFLHLFGYDLYTFYNFVHANPVDVLGPVLEKYQRVKSSGKFSFVQIGANDGKNGDPLHNAVRPDWAGVLVEPNPDTFEALKQTYKDQPSFKFVNVAIADKDGTATLHVPVAKSESTNCSLKSIVVNPKLDISLDCKDVIVPTLTVKSLFKQEGVGNELDMFVVDAEGYDYDIMKQFLKLNLTPPIILFEYSPMEHNQFVEIYSELSTLGYKVSLVNYDVLCTKF